MLTTCGEKRRKERKVLEILRVLTIYQRIPCLERTFNLDRLKGQTFPIIIIAVAISTHFAQLSCF